MHYMRWWTKGDPGPAQKLKFQGEDPLDRFWHYTDKTDDCWLWVGLRDTTKGYPVFYYQGKLVRAHRWSYEQFVGPVPDGLEIDHTCRVRHCVNPDHLEPVTHAENMRRASPYIAAKRRKTHCPRGHELVGRNLAIRQRTNGTTYRACAECDRIRSREYQRRKARSRLSS